MKNDRIWLLDKISQYVCRYEIYAATFKQNGYEAVFKLYSKVLIIFEEFIKLIVFRKLIVNSY